MKKTIEMKFLKKNKKLTFGKFIGIKLKDIAESDPGYVVWLWEKTNYLFSPELYKKCKRKLLIIKRELSEERDEDGELGWEQPF